MKDKPTQFTSMAQKRRFEAGQREIAEVLKEAARREIERVCDEKKERENNTDDQSRQSASRPSSEHPSGA